MARRTLGAVVIGVLLTAVPASAAPFALETVEIAHLFPDLVTIEQGPLEVTAPDVLSFALTTPGSFGVAEVAILDAAIQIRADVNLRFEAATFHGFRITDLNHTIPAFLAVTLGGAPSPLVAFDEDNIFLNLAGLNLNRNDTLTFDVVASEKAAVVPEPSTLLLTGLGLALLTRRRPAISESLRRARRVRAPRPAARRT